MTPEMKELIIKELRAKTGDTQISIEAEPGGKWYSSSVVEVMVQEARNGALEEAAKLIEDDMEDTGTIYLAMDIRALKDKK